MDGETEWYRKVAALAAMQGGDAVLAERERCAKIADDNAKAWQHNTDGVSKAFIAASQDIAAAIRGGA